MSIAIRSAEPDDINALIATDAFAQRNEERRAHLAHWIEKGVCSLAERDGEVLGYIVLTRNFFHSFFIELVTVADHERRSGIGTALIHHVIDMVPPGEKLWTSTNASNTPMRNLLARLGFIESGRIDNLDEGDPELVFLRLP